MEKAHNVMDDHSAFRQLRLCHTEGVVQMGILPIVPYLERRMDFRKGFIQVPGIVIAAVPAAGDQYPGRDRKTPA